MPIRFHNITIPGIVLNHNWERPMLLQRAVPRWGVFGLEVVTARVGSRMIDVQILLHNRFNSYQALANQLDILDRYHGAGDSNVVITTPAMTRTFQNCIFLGAMPEQGPGNGPVQDVAGTLDGGWWQIVRCQWLQTALNRGLEPAPN